MKNFKKLIFTFMFAVLLMPVLNAASVNVNTEEELLNAVKSDGTIVLNDNITLTKALEVKGNNVIIDLNGKTITIQNGYNGYFDLFKGKLEFTGKGTIKDVRVKKSVAATIWVEGSTDVNDKDFSVLTIGKDVTIDTTQWGLAVSHTDGKAYGLTVNFNGKIVSSAVNGGGITVFGDVKNTGNGLTNAPVINLSNTASVKAVGDAALYAAGVGIWYIDGGTYEGLSTIGAKSGKFVINNGMFIATGVPKTGELYGNGIISTGSVIQIENNKGYAGNIEITVNGGTFKSEKGSSIYHYPPNEEGETNALKSLIINGGTFTGDVKMVEGDKVSVTNGTFSTKTLESYIPNTYTMARKAENEYVVSNIEFSEVEGLEAKITSNGTDNKLYAKPGSKVELTFTIENNYFLKGLTVVGKDGSETKVEVTDNSFVMPEYAVKIIPDVIRCISKEGNIVQIDKEITFNESIDAKLVKDLSEAFLDNTNSGLANVINKEKIEATDESIVEVELKTVLTSYDEKNNTLVYDIKPIYYVDGQKVGTLSNDAITGKVKVNLPVPTSVKDTHVKVLHKSGDKLVDEKSYEIKTTEDGKKYITIETDSFSTFELSFYTPTEVKNPTTADSTLGYGLLVLISLIGIGSAYGLMRKSFNK